MLILAFALVATWTFGLIWLLLLHARERGANLSPFGVRGLMITFVVIIAGGWGVAIYATGLMRLGGEPSMMDTPPAFAMSTTKPADRVVFCLVKGFAGFTLVHANAPPSPPGTRRLRNRGLHIIVDVTTTAAGAAVRVYKRQGRSLSPEHIRGVIECARPAFYEPIGKPPNPPPSARDP